MPLVVAVLTTFTNSTPQLADASTTAVSLIAQYMLNRRWTENWFVWIAVDAVYIALGIVTELRFTRALSLLVIALCNGRHRSWRNHQAASLVEEGAPRPSRDHSEPSIPADR